MLCDVEGNGQAQAGLAHAGATGQHDEVALVESTEQVIQQSEAGGQTRRVAFIQIAFSRSRTTFRMMSRMSVRSWSARDWPML